MKNIRNKRADTAAYYKLTAPAQREGESNFAYSQRLAKMADTRLRRIEKLSSEPGFENITQWAYATALNDIKALYGGGDTFQRRAKKTVAGKYNEKQIQAQITAIKRFLESPTSTKRTIKQSFKRRADALNSKYGTDFSWEDLGQFFNSGFAEKIDFQYASKTNLRAIGVIQRNELKTIEDINAYRESHKLSADQKVVLDHAETLLNKYGDDVVNLFFSKETSK